MRLYLADGSCVSPTAIGEDVPIQVGKSSVPIDFIVIGIAADVEVPIILGRPFFATARALINVKEGKLTFTTGGEKVIFNFNKTLTTTSTDDDCYRLEE